MSVDLSCHWNNDESRVKVRLRELGGCTCVVLELEEIVDGQPWSCNLAQVKIFVTKEKARGIAEDILSALDSKAERL